MCASLWREARVSIGIFALEHVEGGLALGVDRVLDDGHEAVDYIVGEWAALVFRDESTHDLHGVEGGAETGAESLAEY
jgi:hypothetical protein